jgi:hypothetical protein
MLSSPSSRSRAIATNNGAMTDYKDSHIDALPFVCRRPRPAHYHLCVLTIPPTSNCVYPHTTDFYLCVPALPHTIHNNL